MKQEKSAELMNKIESLCKRRGFIFPGSEIYGGLSNSWDYGPLGVELKNNIKQAWWKRFVHMRDDMVGIDAALIMNPKVWQSSGHLENFSDPLVECKKCHARFRGDHLLIESKLNKEYGIVADVLPADKNKQRDLLTEKKIKCPNCKSINWDLPKQFNLMLKTFLGPVDDENATVYFRPETAQAMFVDFKNVVDTTRRKLPFGIAQIGKAFRNEITPGNFIFRTREFEQMEIEYFIKEEDWKEKFEEWRKEMWAWMTDELGLDKSNIHENDIAKDELAHYSKKTIDFEFEYPFGRKELYGLAYRTDFDLKNHFKEEPYIDAESGEKLYPHVIEPSLGVDRSFLAVLLDAYKEEEDRVVLKLKPSLAPYKVAVFPLLKNKPELVEKAREVFHMLKKEFTVAFDDRGNIGKRYYSQDEIGTPFCVTIDFDSLEKGDVTVRDRDTMKQERIKINELTKYINEHI